MLSAALDSLGADISFMSDEFATGSGADRTTDVEIALIYLRKPKSKQERSAIWDELQKAQEQVDEECGIDKVAVTDFPLCYVRQYQMEAQAGLALIREWRALSPYIMKSDDKYASPLLDLKCVRSDGSSRDCTSDYYLRALRKKYWDILFHRTKFLEKCTEAMLNQYMNMLHELYDRDKRTILLNQVTLLERDVERLTAQLAEKDEEIDCLRHNVAAMKSTLEQQAENCEKLLAERNKRSPERLTTPSA